MEEVKKQVLAALKASPLFSGVMDMMAVYKKLMDRLTPLNLSKEELEMYGLAIVEIIQNPTTTKANILEQIDALLPAQASSPTPTTTPSSPQIAPNISNNNIKDHAKSSNNKKNNMDQKNFNKSPEEDRSHDAQTPSAHSISPSKKVLFFHFLPLPIS